MNRRFLLGLVLAGLVPGFAADKIQLPKELPPYGPLKPADAPRVIQERLENGMTIWLAPIPGFPKVAFVVAVHGGRASDPRDRPGLSELLAAALTQGTKSKSARQIAEEAQGAGGDLSGDDNPDAVFLDISVLSSKAEVGLDVLADVSRNASFADNEVEIAKQNAATSLEASEAQPSFLGRRALYRALFGDHPYSVTAPTKEAIANTTTAELRREFARRYRPDQAVLVAVGDFDPAQMSAAIRSRFAEWSAPAGDPVAGVSRPEPAAQRAIVLVPRANSVQTALSFGTLGPRRRDSDYAAARVANAIYGGSFSSRLTSNIREDKGYTYSPGSFLAPAKEIGILETVADVRNAVTGASFNEISYEMNRMATTAPEQDELDRAKRYIVGSRAIQLQSRASVARSLAALWVDGLPPEELGLDSKRIEKVTYSDVEAAGKKYFPVRRMIVVAVGEEKTIKDELSPFGMDFQQAK
jgi:zinc protease